MSMFSKLDAIGSRVQDVVNAGWIRIIPMADPVNPNAKRGADPAREVMDVEAIFEYPSIEFGMELGVRKSYREANDLRNVSVGRTPDVSIDRKWFPDLAKEPRQGDRILMLRAAVGGGLEVDPNYPPFEVMDNQRDGLARTALRLVQLGNQK